MYALMIPTMQTDFSIITNVPLSVCLPEDWISHKIWIYLSTWTKMWCITSFRGLLPLRMGKVILFYVHVVGDRSGLKCGLNRKINGLIFTEICLFVDSLFS